MIGGRKTRSNKGVKRGPRTGRTRSGLKFRGRNSVKRNSVRRTRKVRSNKGKRRGSYKAGRTRSGLRYKSGGGKHDDHKKH